MAVTELFADFSRSSGMPGDPIAFIEWWQSLESRGTPALQADGAAFVLRDPTFGEVTLRRLGSSAPIAAWSPQTEFAIHGLVEPPGARGGCQVCAGSGQTRRATLRALDVRFTPEKLVAVCDAHAVFLDGSLQAYVPGGSPRCEETGGLATFVCGGPYCRWQKSWSDGLRVVHPEDREFSYCRRCYARLFPACVGSGSPCSRIGHYFCEHVEPDSDQACGAGICPQHARRWLIFGPEKEGICLCPKHHNVLKGDPVEAVRRMVLATAAKRIRLQEVREPGWREVALPGLLGFQHTLRRLSSDERRRRINTDPNVILGWLAEFRAALTGRSRIHRTAAELMERGERRWSADLERNRSNLAKAPQMLERVKAVLPQVYRYDSARIAASLEALDFREAWGAEKEAGLVGTLIFTTRDPQLAGLVAARANRERLEALTRIRLIFQDSAT